MSCLADEILGRMLRTTLSQPTTFFKIPLKLFQLKNALVILVQ